MEELEDLSVKLYRYLSDYVVGSEKAVKYRQVFFKVLDECSHRSRNSLISSGSKSEGLDLPGSDLDIMVLLKAFNVYEKGVTRNEIFMDTDDAQPGFTLLKVEDSKHTRLPSQIYTNTFTENSYIISNKDFLKEFLKSCPPNFNYYGIQGPSIAHDEVNMDIVPCLQCKKWPTKAEGWLRRSRYSEWPSTDLIEQIKYFGVLVVPVGPKFYSDEGNSFEWRLSFSLAEKILVHSFNHTQILCYSLLKIFLKEIINKDINLKKLLSSYYMKTLIFWVLEEVNHESWIPQKLFFWFLFCVQRLQYWIMINYIPNYFIPEHNLIDGKFSNESQCRLLTIFDRLLVENDWNFLLSAGSLQRFQLNGSNDKVFIKEETQAYRAFYPLFTICVYFNFTAIFTNRSFNMVQNTSISKLERNLWALQFIRNILSLCVKKTHPNNLNNTSRYMIYNRYLSCILISTFGDAITGWFHLAMFYYINQEYNKMLQVLHVTSEVLSLDLIRIPINSHLTFSDLPFIKDYSKCKSFIKRIRREVTMPSPFIRELLRMDNNSLCYHRDFLIFCNQLSLLSCPPVVIFRYLSFLYHLKTKNNIQFALYCLKDSVNQCSCPASLLFLKYAYELYPVPYTSRDLFDSFTKLIERISLTEWQDIINLNCSFRTANELLWRQMEDQFMKEFTFLSK